MPEITISFEVWKTLTMMRESESQSYDDVIRQLLPKYESTTKPQSGPLHSNNLSRVSSPEFVKSEFTHQSNPHNLFCCIGGSIPVGTRLRKRWNGITHEGVVCETGIEYRGKMYRSPSTAAGEITRNSVNGWIWWQCQLPGANKWILLNECRRSRQQKI